MSLTISRLARDEPPFYEIRVPCGSSPQDALLVEFGTRDNSINYCGFTSTSHTGIILASREDAVALAKAILEEYGEEYRTETDAGQESSI